LTLTAISFNIKPVGRFFYLHRGGLGMILVTGASGHIGNVLVRELERSGQSVRVLALPSENLKPLAGTHAEILLGNICDPASLARAMRGVDVVYHLAALVSISDRQEDLLRQVNVEGTRNIIYAARQAGVRRLVYTSSIHAITRPPDGVKIDETLPFDPQNPAGPYDRSKAEASILVQQAAAEGLDAVIVCPTGVVGPFDFRRSEMGELIIEWMRGGVSVLVKGEFDWVDVRDVARGHILAAERGRRGETYLLGGSRVSLVQMRQIVQQISGRHIPAIQLPFGVAMWAANFTAPYYRITGTRPRFTRYALETIVSNSDIDSSKAGHELGYYPRPMYETLLDTVAWWQKNQRFIQASVRFAG
jgi:dihydroflavonol-4-reductase